MKSLHLALIDDDDVGAYVDDLLEAGGSQVRAQQYLPEEVESEDLFEADLVLLDLDVKGWKPQPGVPALQLPQDGLGFASVVRSYFRMSHHSGAVSLLSDKLEELASGLTRHPSEHAIARLHGLEWAFDKRGLPEQPGRPDPPGLAERIIELAAASRRARELWPTDELEDAARLEDFMALSEDAAWATHARLLMNYAQPPIFDLATASNGQSVVRWLAQRILPHPGLLLDSGRLAVQLGASPDSLNAVLAERASLGSALDAAVYSGAMSAFLGRRWWRSGVLAAIESWNEGRPVMSDDGFAVMQAEIDAPLERLPLKSVICMDIELKGESLLAQRHEVVRIRPDDWPVFADPAFVRMEDLRDRDDDRVRHALAFVDPSDRRLLDQPA